MESLNDVILREIGTLSRCINYTNNLKFKKIDLQAGQFIFLTRICENQSINQTHLTALLKVDKATTAKAVQKLIQAGYVRRARDQSDRRCGVCTLRTRHWPRMTSSSKRKTGPLTPVSADSEKKKNALSTG